MKFEWIQTVLMVAVVVALAGCNSIRSTLLTRNEPNTGWCKVSHLKGVPITLKVPSHLKVVITEKHFISGSAVNNVTNFEYVKLPTPIRNVSTEIIKTEKVFTVDFKRPAAGTMKMELDMDAERQYFEKISHEVEDETLAEIGNLIDSLAGAGFRLAAAESGVDPTKALREVDSVVAIQLFELDDPMLEQNVVHFLNCHLNQSHDAYVVPPGVDNLNRVGIQQNYTGDNPTLCSQLPIESGTIEVTGGCSGSTCNVVGN